MQETTVQKLWDFIEPLVSDEGYELIDLEYIREKNWVLRIFVDRPNLEFVPGLGIAPGQGITLDECVKVSRQLSTVLDVEEIIPNTYTLEVSSPGVQRPLKRLEDFQRFQGCQVRVKTFEKIISTNPKKKRPSKSILGILTVVEEDHVELEHKELTYHIPFEKIARANVDPDMDEWMRLAKKARNERGV